MKLTRGNHRGLSGIHRPIPPADIRRLYAELDAANARRDSGKETHAEQRERWAIEDALARRQA
jgi:hypothetical protein